MTQTVTNAGWTVRLCDLTDRQLRQAMDALRWEEINWDGWTAGERGWIGLVPVVCAAVDPEKKEVELYARRVVKGGTA
jgi:hypothetical protein